MDYFHFIKTYIQVLVFRPLISGVKNVCIHLSCRQFWVGGRIHSSGYVTWIIGHNATFFNWAENHPTLVTITIRRYRHALVDADTFSNIECFRVS